MKNIYTGFYKKYFASQNNMQNQENSIRDFSFMEVSSTFKNKENTINPNISPYDFLHGYCDIFALALHDTFGYPIYAIKNNQHEYIAIHYFCKPKYPIGCFVDVRGITNNKSLFLEDFEDWLDDTYIAKANPIAIQKKMQEDHNESIYHIATTLIHEKYNEYNVKNY